MTTDTLIIISFLPITLLFIYLLLVTEKRYVLKHMEFDSSGKHTAIIIYDKNLKSKIYVYFSGINNLIRCFIKNKIPYKVYYCNNSQEFKKVIYNKKTNILYLFAHGRRHSFAMGKIAVDYCELKDAPKKDFIAQFHCNHGGGTSLAEYIAKRPKQCFVSNNVRRVYQNYFDIKKMCKNINKGKKPF